MADHPLRPAKDLRLGKQLPYQLPNLAKVHSMAKKIFSYPVFSFILNNQNNYHINDTIIPDHRVDAHVLLTRSPLRDPEQAPGLRSTCMC